MRLKFRYIIAKLSILAIAVIVLYKMQSENVENIIFQNYCAEPINKTKSETENGGTCQIPKLDPFHPQAMQYIHKVIKPLQCQQKKRATLRSGMLHITGSDVRIATYCSITRPSNNDFKYILGDLVTVDKFPSFPVSDEFIVLTMTLYGGGTVTEYLMQAVRRPELVARTKEKTELDLSFLIVGIESTSNAHAQRKLPLSYDYIKNVLGGYVFMGHSTVGDGTTEQLAALLTGKGEQEYHESRTGEPGASTIDNWNWLFRKAKEYGYVTSFSEDTTRLATFQNRLLGFNDPPTDYYPRPFFLAAEKKHDKKNMHCLGSQETYGYHLDLATKIYEEYPDRKKFLLHFASEISHENISSVEHMDEALLDFMQDFSKKGYLNDTILIVLGDHGWRVGKFRQTMQGKLEERLPLFTMTFPKWFYERYSDLAKNLETNTNRLTSWFDVHATFNEIFDYPRPPANIKHGMSLFQEVPADRSCQQASIPEHWCPCIQWSAVETTHAHVILAAREAVHYINDLNLRDQLSAKYCHELQLRELRHGEVKMPSDKVARFKQSADYHGYIADFESGRIRWKDSCHYQVTFVTLPNNGVFEASVHYINGKFLVEGGISRLNMYNDQPKCIAKELPHLKKYCSCNNKLWFS